MAAPHLGNYAATDALAAATLAAPRVLHPPPPPRRRQSQASRIAGGLGSGAITAAATPLRVGDTRQAAHVRRLRQPWQAEALDRFRDVPEAGYAARFLANNVSRVRLFPAVRQTATATPEPDEGPSAEYGQELLDWLEIAPGGVPGLLSDLTVNLEFPGECSLVYRAATADRPESWDIKSILAFSEKGGRWVIREDPGDPGTPLGPDDAACRLYLRDPFWPGWAWSPMGATLDILDELLLLQLITRAEEQSRLQNGILIVPNSISFGATNPTFDDSDGEAQQDPAIQDLLDACMLAVQTPGDPAAMVPVIWRVPDEVVGKVQQLVLKHDIDFDTINRRTELQVLRLARGLDVPVEVVLGHMNTTFANGEQIDRSTFDDHVAPLVIAECEMLTSGYYRPMLIEGGMSPEEAARRVIWFDPSELISKPDQLASSNTGLAEGVIGGEAWRRVNGYTEDDKPNDDEIIERILLRATRLDPEILGQLLQRSGIAPSIKVPAPAAALPAASQAKPADAGPSSLTAAGRSRRNLGVRLNTIDSKLRTRLEIAADAAMRRALDRAGAKLVSRAKRSDEAKRLAAGAPQHLVAATLGRPLVAALGTTDDELLDNAWDGLADSYDAWVEAAQDDALNLLDPLGLGADQRAAAQHANTLNRTAGWAALATALASLAAARLYDPNPELPAQGEINTLLAVPPGIIRAALARAGGNEAVRPDGTVPADQRAASAVPPLGGVAVGPTTLGVAGELGAQVDGWTWVHGDTDRPFPQHEDLDGVTFTAWDDPILTNVDVFPTDTPFLFPADHLGCSCEAVPTILTAADLEG